MTMVRFGPAGYPEESRGKPERVFEILREAGLNALEFAAVYGLRSTEERARLVGKLANESDVSMSLHAAYYINLASKSAEIRERSKARLTKALRFAPLMAAKRVVFHPGTMGGLDRDEAYRVIKDALREVRETADRSGNDILLAPEIAGKVRAFGSVEEITRLCNEVEGTIPTIDWAHLHARSNGGLKDRNNYLSVLTGFENDLGARFVDNMHFHVSGVTFTESGESSHKPLGGKWGPDILPLIEIVSEAGYGPTVISETPNPIRGALYSKFLLEELEASNK
ncbi:MAG: TIM barrel protein [Candidatus Thorarchaeota archaeon]|nr:MAG: TIM barrel protein [Candidatus Thorarchaeota archaeon]